MIGVDVNSLPFQSKITYQMIRWIRLSRNLSQSQFSEVTKIDQSVLAKLERNEIELSIHYETKIMDGVRALNISQYELEAIKTLLKLKNNN